MAKQKESEIGWREPRWTPDCGYSKTVMMAKIFLWQMSLNNSSYLTQAGLYDLAEKIKVDEDIDIELSSYYATRVRVTSHTWDFAKDSAHQLKNGAIISKDSLQETDRRFYFLKGGVFCGGRLSDSQMALIPDGQYMYITKQKIVKNGRIKYGDDFIFKKIGTYDECMQAYAKEHEKLTQTIDMPRTGPDYRHGKDVSIEDILKEFPFQAITIHQGMRKKDAQVELNALYDSMHDICSVLGMTPDEATLHGELSIELGSTSNRGRYLAAFYHQTNQIRITPTGSATFFHEFFHAIDFNLLPMPEHRLERELKSVMNRTEFVDRCRAATQSNNPGYWTDPHELFARAAEQYMRMELEKNGISNAFLTDSAETYANSSVYPTAEESKKLAECYDRLFQEVFHKSISRAEFIQRYGSENVGEVDYSALGRCLGRLADIFPVEERHLLFDGDMKVVPTKRKTQYKDGVLYFNGKDTEHFTQEYVKAMLDYSPAVSCSKAKSKDEFVQQFTFLCSPFADAMGYQSRSDESTNFAIRTAQAWDPGERKKAAQMQMPELHGIDYLSHDVQKTPEHKAPLPDHKAKNELTR